MCSFFCAFVINEKIKNQIINNDPKSAELIKPYIKATDIDRYVLKNANAHYFINTNYDLDITKYKGIHNWLLNFNEKHPYQIFCLVPLSDMFNHNPPASFLFRGDIDTLDFHADVVKTIECGDEISTEYWQPN